MTSDTIERFRGDTYPVEFTLSRDGDWTLSGSTVEMSFEFDDAVIYTFLGSVTSEVDKTVSFEPTVAAIDTVRDGVYDIQVDDGTYVTTHAKGVVSILQDVTV